MIRDWAGQDRFVSVKTLVESFPNVERKNLVLLRKLIHGDVKVLDLVRELGLPSYVERWSRPEAVVEVASHLLGHYGTEAIQGNDWVSSYWRETRLLYTNSGDTYNPAILYDTMTKRYSLGCWGDFVERHPSWFA